MFNKNKSVNNVIKFFTTKLDKRVGFNNNSNIFNFFKKEKNQTKTPEIQKTQGLETSREVNTPQEIENISREANSNILISSTPDIAVKNIEQITSVTQLDSIPFVDGAVKDSEQTTSETQEEQKKLTTQTHQTTDLQFQRRITNLLVAIPQKVKNGTEIYR